jgi:hypothetical protein
LTQATTIDSSRSHDQPSTVYHLRIKIISYELRASDDVIGDWSSEKINTSHKKMRLLLTVTHRCASTSQNVTVNWPLAVWAFGPHKKVAVACPGDLLSCEPYVFQSMGWGRPEVHS